MNLFTIIAASFCMIAMSACGTEQPKDERPQYIKYVDAISYEVISEVEKEFGLECGGTGGCMARDVEQIGILFYSPYSATIEQARELEIKIMRKLVDKVNSHEKIRPFLREYPFTMNRVNIRLNFPDADPQLTDIEYLFNAKGKIYYYRTNKITNKLEDVFSETIEDAIKALENKPKEISKGTT